MNVVLVFPPFYLESMYNLPPLGLINLATALKGLQHQVVVIDFVLALRQKTLGMGEGIYADCAEAVLERDPDVVGFSAQCTTYPALIQIARKIKERKASVLTVVGGHNASFVDELTLERFPAVDSIVRGEGEITFRELVTAYDRGESPERVLGVTHRLGERILRNPDRPLMGNLDELPLPDYSFVPPLAEYRDACALPRSIAILEVGRGCPHRCIYCSESIFWRRRTRTFAVDRLVEEMGNLHRNFGAECFLLAYDQFTARRGFVEAFCRKVIEAELDHLPWYCISRLDSVDAALLHLMRQAGCESMCYGIDSGSRRTLSFIRKNIDHSVLFDRVKETADQGIIPTLSFVIGFPEEHREDIDETLELALRTGIVGNNNPLIQLPTVLPGTDLYHRYADSLVRHVDTYFALGLEFNNGRRLRGDEALIDANPMLCSSFYNLPCPGLSVEELDSIAGYIPLIVRLYPKSFLLLSRETRRPVSLLFLDWLRWLAGHFPRTGLSLSAQDCYLHFSSFVSELLAEVEEFGWKHLPDVLKYENTAVEVGRFTSPGDAFSIDLNNIGLFRPMRSRRIAVEEFAFDIPLVIIDMIAGRFRRDYPFRRTWLVFRQEDSRLEVDEINAFGRDLLELCDGSMTVEEIARRLQGRYGGDMDPLEFLGSCAEAVHTLGEMKLLDSGQSDDVKERR
jgi:radical SAM superfamily enzyme YgiQ (UPF0313 family)